MRFYCVFCAPALFKMAKRHTNDVSWQLFRPTWKILLLQRELLGFRVWTQLILAEIECQWCRQTLRRRMCMQLTAMCFSVMVRANDSQTAFSVISAHSEGWGLSGSKKHALENTARECHTIKYHKTLCLQVKVIFLKKKGQNRDTVYCKINM